MRNDETPEGDTPRQKAISIHSLRVEGDLQPMQKCGVLHDFNPLPPCGGRQAEMPKASATFFYFNPLPPCGGRLPAGMMAGNASYFNPLPPCGGRPLRRICGADQQRISIHSLRVEGDAVVLLQFLVHVEFQSTPSVWRETRFPVRTVPLPLNFNPLPPCGGRQRPLLRVQQQIHFNPLPPCGGRPGSSSGT